MTPCISLHNVTLSFGPITIHDRISLNVQTGEVVTLLGPSGVGKTLILKMIMGFLRPQSGEVHVLGEPMHDLGEEEKRDIRAKVGMLFQGGALFDSLSVYENIAYGLRERGTKDESIIFERVRECLEVVALPGVERKMPNELSGGQKKRVGLARALASRPEILLFDEPTTGLDPTSTRKIDDLIIRLQQDFRITCIAVTHDIASAKRISDRWILFGESGIAAKGHVDELLARSEPVQKFVEGRWNSYSGKSEGELHEYP